MARKHRRVGASFHVHETMVGEVRNMPQVKDASLKNVNHLLARMFADDGLKKGMNPFEVVSAPDFRRFTIEYDMADGGPAIFPESFALVVRMLKSKFNFQKSIDLSLPFESFVMSMPKGLVHDGDELMSVSVRQDHGVQGISDVAREFGKAVRSIRDTEGVRYFHDEHLDMLIDDPFFGVPDEQRDMTYISVMVEFAKNGASKDPDFVEYRMRSDLLSLALKSNKREDFISLCKLYDEDLSNTFKIDRVFSKERCGEMLYYGIKALASMSVYMALDGNKLKEGLPGKYIKDKHNLHMTGQNVSPYLLSSTPAIEREVVAKGAHYRQSHFRNLRDERFYRGEHADKEIGSRWVAVSDSLINSMNDPNTLTM